MKKLILIILALAFAAVAFATYTKQTTRVARAQVDVVYDSTGTAISVPFQAFYANRVLVNDSDSTDKVNPGNFGPVSIDLLAVPVSTTSYTAAGKTVTGAQAAALLQAIFLAEATRQSVP